MDLRGLFSSNLSQFGFFKLFKFWTFVAPLCFFVTDAFGKVQLYVFPREFGQAALVFPASDQEDLQVQIERYLERITKQPDLMILDPDMEMLREVLRPERAKLLSASINQSLTNVALIANEFSDFAPTSGRVRMNVQFFGQAQTSTYLLPLAGDLHLDGQAKNEYRSQVGRTFGILVGMGGDDVHPKLYQEKITYSGQVSYIRDASEVLLIQAYNRYGKGLYFGICRGHQIGAVARGDHMNQDLSLDGVANTNDHSMNGDYRSHEERWHTVELVHPLLVQLFGSRHFPVNSYHHQSVRLTLGSTSMLGAVSTADRVVEALVSEDGRSIGLQFHLEIHPQDREAHASFLDLGRQFVTSLVSYSQEVQYHNPRFRSCRLIL